MGTYTKTVTIQVEQVFEDEHDTVLSQKTIEGDIDVVPIVEKSYVIGVSVNKNDKLRTFVIKSPNFKINKGDNVLTHKEVIATAAKAQAMATDMLAECQVEYDKVLEERIRKFTQEQDDLQPGEVIIYVDEGAKEHFAVVICPGDNVSKMLFVTSTQAWNDRSRRMTDEERNLTGMVFRNPISFFAPVVRPNVYANKCDSCYPQHRVEELEREFFQRG